MKPRNRLQEKRMELYPGIHHFETGPFNWYVVEEDGRLTLIDAGFPGHYSIFRDGLDQMAVAQRMLRLSF